MKKILCATVCGLCLISSAVSAQRAISVGDNQGTGACSYTPLQEIIRDARSEADLAPITKNNVNLNAPVKCGGTVLQLAVLRGNPQVVRALLEAGADVKTPVSTQGFNMTGAPKEIPILHFAGFYAPRQDIVNLIISAGADVTATDENGESVLWYINQNPVLRNTALSDDIRNTLLLAPKNMNGAGARLDPSSTSPVSGMIADVNGKPVMRKVVDPRVPQLSQGQAIITKTGKNTVGLSDTPAVQNAAPLSHTSAGRNNAQLYNAATSANQAAVRMNAPTSGQTDTLEQLPQGTRVISSGSAFPTREIVEPDMPVTD
mgnify:CR=1 FL=1